MKHSESALLVVLMLLGGGALFAYKPPSAPVASPPPSRAAPMSIPINDICPLSGRKVDPGVAPFAVATHGAIVLVGLCGECCRIGAAATPPARLLEAARGNAVLRGLYFAVFRRLPSSPSDPTQKRSPHGSDAALHGG